MLKQADGEDTTEYDEEKELNEILKESRARRENNGDNREVSDEELDAILQEVIDFRKSQEYDPLESAEISGTDEKRYKLLEQTEEYAKLLEQVRAARKEIRHYVYEIAKAHVIETIDKMVEGPRNKFSKIISGLRNYKQDVRDGFDEINQTTKEQKRNIGDSVRNSKKEDTKWAEEMQEDGRNEKVIDTVQTVKENARNRKENKSIRAVRVTGKIAKLMVPIERLTGKKGLAKSMVEKVGARGERHVSKDSRLGKLLQRAAEFGFKVSDKARNVKTTFKEKTDSVKEHVGNAKDRTSEIVKKGARTVKNKAITIGEGARLTADIGILLAEKIVKSPIVAAKAGVELAKKAGRNIKEKNENVRQNVKEKIEQTKLKTMKSVLETLNVIQENLNQRLNQEVYAQRDENPYSKETNEINDNFDVDMEIPTAKDMSGDFVDILSSGRPESVRKTGGSVEPESLEKKGMRIIGGLLGHTHASVPSATGKLNGKDYVSLKRNNVAKDMNGQTIITDDSIYDISTYKDGRDGGNYSERIVSKDGIEERFETRLSSDSVYYRKSKDGITFTESATLATMAGDDKVFSEYAQPDASLADEYSRVTGLPKIESGSYATSLTAIIRAEDEKNTFPYVVKMEAHKKDENGRPSQTKSVQYVYSSPEAYRNGEQPSMIYMEGLDGRSGSTGMFRKLPDGSYIDNSTFRKENGEYTYDTISYDEITGLTGKFPIKLSERADLAARGEFRIPSDVKKVYDSAVKGIPNKETQENSKDSGDER